MARRAIILDRDGTLNVDMGYVWRIEDWRFTDGAIEAIQLFSAGGFAITVVTNQSGIARGLYTEQHVQQLHDHVRDLLAQSGITIAAMAYCPHGADDDCECRKPRMGMAQQLESQLGDMIDYSTSWTIGDKLSDFAFGRALGTHTALIHSQYWNEGQLATKPDLLADSLYDAATRIMRQE